MSLRLQRRLAPYLFIAPFFLGYAVFWIYPVINGLITSVYSEQRGGTRGFIGLQVHSVRPGTGPYHVRWKNIRLRELKPGEKAD